MKRRDLMGGFIVTPLLPLAASAGGASNSTDAAWAAYLVAQGAADEASAAAQAEYDAGMADSADGLRQVEANEKCRNEIFRVAFEAGRAVLDAPVATMIDVERKLAVISQWGGAHQIEPELIDQFLAQIREATGGATV